MFNQFCKLDEVNTYIIMSTRRKFLGSSLLTAATTLLWSDSWASSPTSNCTLSTDLPTEEFWEQVRSMFPIPKDQAYFNTGTLGVSPYPVLEAITHSIRSNAAQAATTDYKGEGPLLLSGYEAFEDVRRKVAQLINADYQEISLTQNATFGMNFMAHGLELKKNDEIIQTDQEHGGGCSAWQMLAQRHQWGYKQIKLPVPSNDPQQIVDLIFDAVSNKTRVIAIPAIVSVYGVVMPVKEICRRARELGILTVLDGAQCVGQIPVNVKEIGCDAYFSSLHKWLLAPGGSGILYVHQDLQPKLWATMASYNWQNQEDHGFRLQQYGTGLPGIVKGLEAALDFHQTVGPSKWTSRVKELGDYLRQGLMEIPKLEIHSSTHPQMCAGLTTYHLPGVSGPEIQKEMWTKAQLQPRSVGKELVRHSTHIYNNKSQIDKSLEILKEISNRL